MLSLIHNLRTFLFHEKLLFRSLELSNFLHFKHFPIIYKVVTSWWVLVDELENILECILWILNHLVMKSGHHVVVGNFHWKYFAWFGGLSPKSEPYLIYQTTVINLKLFMAFCMWFFTFSKVVIETIEYSKYLLIIRIWHIVISWKCILLFQENH